MNALRYAVFDIDGTIADDNGRVASGTAEALTALRGRGLLPMLLSGRSLLGLRALPEVLALLPLFEPDVLLANGDAVYDSRSGRLECVRVLPAAAVDRLLGAGIADLVLEERGEHVALTRRAAMAYAVAYQVERADVPVRPWEGEGTPTRITVLGAAGHDAGPVGGVLTGLGCTTYPIAAFSAVVVQAAETAKQTALAALLAERHGEPGLDRVIAFGDGDNDAGLLAAARVGVAVAGSGPLAVARADVVLREPLVAFLDRVGPDYRPDPLTPARR